MVAERDRAYSQARKRNVSENDPKFSNSPKVHSHTISKKILENLKNKSEDL